MTTTNYQIDQKVLDCFWEVANVDPDVRQKAIWRLLTLVINEQEKSALNSQLCPLTSYCLNRLMKRLVSSNRVMLESCSMVLVLILKRLPFFTAMDFLALMDQSLHINSSISSGDQVDTDSDAMPETRMQKVKNGRCLAFAVALKLEYHKQSSTTLLQMVKGVMSLYSETTLRESCALHLIEMITSSDESWSRDVFISVAELQQLCKRQRSKASAEDLLVCLQLWSFIPSDVLSQCDLVPHVTQPPSDVNWIEASEGSFLAAVSETIFEKSRLEEMAKCLRDCYVTQPRLHSVWETLLKVLLCDVDRFTAQTPKQKVVHFWTYLIEPLSDGSAQKQSLALALSVQILPQLSACYLPHILGGIHSQKPRSVVAGMQSFVGKYWRNVLCACRSKDALQIEAVRCFDQIVSIGRNTAEKDAPFHQILLYCRIPAIAHYGQCRADLLSFVTADGCSLFTMKQIATFLSPDSTESDRENILKDFQSLLKLDKLDQSTVAEIMTFMVTIGLFRVKKRTDEDRLLKSIRKAKTELKTAIRQRSLSIAVHCYAAFKPAALLMTDAAGRKASLLNSILNHFDGRSIQLIRNLTEKEKETLKLLRDLSDFLETAISDEGSEENQKKLHVIHDLLAVIQLYYLTDSDSVSSAVVDDLSRCIAMLFGTVTEIASDVSTAVEQAHSDVEDDDVEMSNEHDMISLADVALEEEEAIDILIGVLIDLCARRTDPLSNCLMTKYVRCTFAVFSAELTMSCWLRLLNAVTSSDDFNVDHSQQLISDDDDDDISDGAEEMTTKTEIARNEDMDSASELNSAFDAFALNYHPNNDPQSKRSQKRIHDDVESASARVLTLIEHIVKKHPKKGYTILTPVHLITAILSRSDLDTGTENKPISIRDRLVRVFDASLSCKPEIEANEVDVIREEMSQFVMNAPRKSEYKERISKAVAFVILRLLYSVTSSDVCQEAAVQICKIALSQHFTRRGPVLQGNATTSLLSQNRQLAQQLIPFIVKCGSETNRTQQKLRALEFLIICLQDKDASSSVEEILDQSEIQRFLHQVLEIEVSGRLQLEILQAMTKLLRVLKKRGGKSQFRAELLTDIQTIIDQRRDMEQTIKLKRKWTQLSEVLPNKKTAISN